MSVNPNDDPSYSAESVYSVVPQFIKDHDEEVDYPLYGFLYGATKNIQALNAIVRDNVGVDGTVQTSGQYVGAPGWSQIMDIDRCPDEGLSWLGQFVGVRLNSQLTKQEKKDKITSWQSFQRGNPDSMKTVLRDVVNSVTSGSVAPLTVEEIVLIENVAPSFSTSTPTTRADWTLVPNQYSMVILLPAAYFSSISYNKLNELAGAGSSGAITYDALDTYIANLGGTNKYNNLESNPVPSVDSIYTSFLYKHRPAGVQIYIGGY
jgi:hypothetical protein